MCLRTMKMNYRLLKVIEINFGEKLTVSLIRANILTVSHKSLDLIETPLPNGVWRPLVSQIPRFSDCHIPWGNKIWMVSSLLQANF